LPFPTRNHRALLRLLLLDIESRPADGAVVGISVSADPVRPRAIQNGLFTPLTPEPDRFELTVARIARLVGTENVGSAELMDTHRPGAFLMRRMAPEANDGRKTKGRYRKRTNKSVLSAARCLPPIGFRVFRPPLPARVETRRGRPVRIASASSPVARSESSNSNATQGLSRDNKHDRRSITAAKKDPPRRSEKRAAINGEILRAAGPWRTTGDWWSKDGWARDEWDITIGRKTRPDRRRDSQPATSPKTIELVRTALPPRESNNSMEGVYRIYQELASGAWFIEGSYD
jgi:protein ImuB